MCDEFKDLPISYERDYVGRIEPLDDKYTYKYAGNFDDWD